MHVSLRLFEQKRNRIHFTYCISLSHTKKKDQREKIPRHYSKLVHDLIRKENGKNVVDRVVFGEFSIEFGWQIQVKLINCTNFVNLFTHRESKLLPRLIVNILSTMMINNDVVENNDQITER